MANYEVAATFFYGLLSGISGVVTRIPDTSQANTGIDFIADSGNTGILYLGNSSLVPNSGWPLRPGDKQKLFIDTPNNVYVVSNQTVASSAVNKLSWIGS